MKKISFKLKKQFSLNKDKGDGDFVMLQQPSLTGSFSKEDPFFGVCYNNDINRCDLTSEEKGLKNRSKSESLMGTLKRRLSAKQRTKGKGSSDSVGSGDDDNYSSSSVPIGFNEVKAQRPLRSSSLRIHHYSPSPWPLRPVNSEEARIKMEVKVKAMVHSPSPSPSLNGIRKEFSSIQVEGQFPNQNGSLKGLSPQNRGLHVKLDENVPVVIGLTPQDYIQYTMPLDEGMYPDGSSPMEVLEVEGDSPHADRGQEEPDLDVPPDLFMEQSAHGLLIPNPRDISSLPPTLFPEIPRTFSGFSSTDPHVAERVRHHLNFDPSSAPGVSRVYDSVQSSGSMVVTSLTAELKKLAKQGWYWGPITRYEAEEKLVNLPNCSFLVRDSSDDRYLLSLSFRSQGKTLHTRIEHSNGRFSFYEQPEVEGHTSIVDLIEHSMKDSENGAFCYSRSRAPGSITYPVRLTNPVSRFMQVRSLQYLCRFVIRQYTRIDLIQKLPLPNKMKDYLQEKHY
ncbi:suppressor of cytokine signaling 6 [Denticeps clupeoides]|uniref:Suppressor of cytokine signaling 6 n=1 Tax=Denticeps clupeoides TaxID=299321 RepID=A0AAY4AKN6_9TELE|nr:suppressor of cytokine signaling 6-like [Denticeps clupeoides]XP_028821482.1 suppressor of cytokine signaling 6-like [Denticeps clupeoides]